MFLIVTGLGLFGSSISYSFTLSSTQQNIVSQILVTADPSEDTLTYIAEKIAPCGQISSSYSEEELVEISAKLAELEAEEQEEKNEARALVTALVAAEKSNKEKPSEEKQELIAEYREELKTFFSEHKGISAYKAYYQTLKFNTINVSVSAFSSVVNVMTIVNASKLIVAYKSMTMGTASAESIANAMAIIADENNYTGISVKTADLVCLTAAMLDFDLNFTQSMDSAYYEDLYEARYGSLQSNSAMYLLSATLLNILAIVITLITIFITLVVLLIRFIIWLLMSIKNKKEFHNRNIKSFASAISIYNMSFGICFGVGLGVGVGLGISWLVALAGIFGIGFFVTYLVDKDVDKKYVKWALLTKGVEIVIAIIYMFVTISISANDYVDGIVVATGSWGINFGFMTGLVILLLVGFEALSVGAFASLATFRGAELIGAKKDSKRVRGVGYCTVLVYIAGGIFSALLIVGAILGGSITPASIIAIILYVAFIVWKIIVKKVIAPKKYGGVLKEKREIINKISISPIIEKKEEAVAE